MVENLIVAERKRAVREALMAKRNHSHATVINTVKTKLIDVVVDESLVLIVASWPRL